MVGKEKDNLPLETGAVTEAAVKTREDVEDKDEGMDVSVKEQEF